MELRIKSNSTTLQVKSAFANQFSGLKIEFFHKSHKEQEGSPKKDIVEDDVPLTSLNENLNAHEINITINQTVSKVEETFETEFGLHVQVFRMMGRIWIETTRTDGYTLQEQMDLSADSLKSYA